MNEIGWTAIRDELKGAGIYVELESLYFQQRQPYWRACASHEGQTWIASGSDLNELFAELRTLTGREVRPAVSPPKESLARALRMAGGRGRGRFSSL